MAECPRCKELLRALEVYGEHIPPCVYACCVWVEIGEKCEHRPPIRKHDASEGCRCGLFATIDKGKEVK